MSLFPLSQRDELELSRYVKDLVAKTYRRQIDRFFSGQITAVTSLNPPGPPFACQIQRLNEKAADGNTYLCATPGYWPQVGEFVDCMWRDGVRGYVLWPTKTPASLGTLVNPSTTVAQGGITALADLTSLSGTVYVGQGRRIRITGKVKASSSVVTDGIRLHIREGTTDLDICDGVGNATDSQVDLKAMWVGVPVIGQHTYKLSLERVAGTGTVATSAGANAICFMHVEDVGT